MRMSFASILHRLFGFRQTATVMAEVCHTALSSVAAHADAMDSALAFHLRVDSFALDDGDHFLQTHHS